MNEVQYRRGRYYFTMIELLTILSIISVLMALLIPALNKVRFEAQRMECANNLKQISLLQNYYVTDHNSVYPAPYTNENGNYWSNILYTLYVKNESLTQIGWHPGDPWGTPPSWKYINYIGFCNLGNVYEHGTIFNCENQQGALYSDTGLRRKFPVSYGMSESLASSPGTTDSKDHHTKAITKISYPDEAMLVMDNGSAYNISVHSWRFTSYQPYPRYDKSVHDGSRNILYCDGRVQFMDSDDIPFAGRGPFWTGTD